MKRKFWTILLVFALLAALLFGFRYKLLAFSANMLIHTDELVPVDYAFVLSGGAKDRGAYASELYNMGYVQDLVCTGANLSPDLESYGIDLAESHLTKMQMEALGIPSDHISVLALGTSTLEESELILAFCMVNKLKKIAVISSLFHTRRLAMVFLKKFHEEGIEVRIYGAASTQYSEVTWWESEAGLIALNNEYIKLFYYWIKY
ncbi:MAG: YdcF family protein [Chitinophagales bacterium]|nr:YdcF family protein [Bacteroidota bacterium]MCB9257687.1 YdcF family protein [Chitinophagales bacterium]